MIREKVFINGGATYKENRVFEGNSVDNYVTDLDTDPIFTFYQNTDNGKKEYRSSTEFRKWLLDYDSVHTLDYNNVCPDITLWLGKAYFSNGYTEEDCYFRVDNSNLLKKVATHYNLPYPITSEVETVLDNTPEDISAYEKDNEHIVVGSIKYLNGSPTHLKFYCIYKDEDNLQKYEHGKVYANQGQVIEEGYKYLNTSTDNLVFKTDKQTYRATTMDNGGDPIAQWEGVITATSEIEHYESSKEMREIVGNLSTGSNYEDRDRCPSVNLWIGRSWVGSKQETLYFYAENSEMVDAVASYYSLPQPYNTELKQQLDENPEIMRFKSYDIYNKGEGNFAALVVAGIVFENNNPTMLKIFELKRWND